MDQVLLAPAVQGSCPQGQGSRSFEFFIAAAAAEPFARPWGKLEGMAFNAVSAYRGFDPARRVMLAVLVVALATVLALPAVIYALLVPSVATALSAIVAIGTFGALITLVRRVWLQLLIAVPILVLNVAEIVHILIYGSLISLGGIEAVLHVDPHEAREFVSEK